MKFEDYEKDEREQWRKQTLTQAYIANLRELMEGSKNTILSYARSSEPASAGLWAGVHDGLDTAIRFAEGDK